MYGSVVNRNNNIYLLGGNNTVHFYKYDPLTNKYTQLENLPYNFYQGSAVINENNIYLLGCDNYKKNNYKLEFKNLLQISKYKYNQVELLEDMKMINEGIYQQLANIPYSFYNGSAATVGMNIYLFGSGDSNNTSTVAKYDVINNVYTRLGYTPTQSKNCSATAIETDIYIFGGLNNETKAYKYNTLTNTYTQLTNIPFNFHNGAIAVAIGNTIYLLGNSSADNINYTYKYDTLTDTYTRLVDIPYTFRYGSATTVGTNIFIFGASLSDYFYTAYKYDTLTNTYTQLTNIPFAFYQGSAVAIDNNIYLFGSGSSSRKYAYKYNTSPNTYTQLANTPYNFYSGSATTVGINVYLFGGGDTYAGKNTYSFSINSINNKTIAIETKNLFSTKLTKQLQTSFSNAQIYDDDELKEYPCYYGDGSKWNLIENN